MTFWTPCTHLVSLPVNMGGGKGEYTIFSLRLKTKISGFVSWMDVSSSRRHVCVCTRNKLEAGKQQSSYIQSCMERDQKTADALGQDRRHAWIKRVWTRWQIGRRRR